MDFTDPNSGDAFYEVFKKEGLHRILGALIHIYQVKHKHDKENEDYMYICEQLSIAGSNVYNNTYEAYPGEYH